MRDFKGPAASVVFLLVPPSESRLPLALITVQIERASHRSSSSELLIFSSISFGCSRARETRFPAGRMTRRYRRNCRPATEFCTFHRRKLTLSRPVSSGNFPKITLCYQTNIIGWQNHKVEYCVVNIVERKTKTKLHIARKKFIITRNVPFPPQLYSV